MASPEERVKEQLADDPSRVRLHKLRFTDGWPLSLGASASPNLVNLTLSRVHLRSIPSEIGLLTNLEFLTITGNKISSVGNELSQLTRLKHLVLTNNSLREFGAGVLEKLVHLELCYLSTNKLKKFPMGLLELSNLRELSLRNNLLKTIPPGISRLRSLEYLSILGTTTLIYPPYDRIVASEANSKESIFQYVANKPDMPGELKKWGRLFPLQTGAWEWTQRNLLQAHCPDHPKDARSLRRKLKEYMKNNTAVTQELVAWRAHCLSKVPFSPSLDDMPLDKVNLAPQKRPRRKKSENNQGSKEPEESWKAIAAENSLSAGGIEAYKARARAAYLKELEEENNQAGED